MNSYKDLKVYEKAYTQAKELYALARTFPKEEQYGLISQLQRAAVSIPMNIAEGYGKRSSAKELMRFLSMARGSSAEIEVLLDFSKDFGYISEEAHTKAKKDQEEIGRMLSGLMKSLTPSS